MSEGTKVLERLRELPGGRELLAVAQDRAQAEEAALVGGAVRDILLERSPREIDVAVSGDAAAFACALARELQTLAGQDPEERMETQLHDRFRTAIVRWKDEEIDIATRRSETYSAPGALPDVSEGSWEQDLQRRDFTVNAIAVPLAGPHAGELRTAEHALEDLAARRLRVLHDRSFIDDPTRLLRLARYQARLGFQIESHTAGLAQAAVAGGALASVSGSRLGAEVRLALAEADPAAALGQMQQLGIFEAWEPGVSFHERLARTALEVLPSDGDRSLLLAASLLLALMERMHSEDTEPSIWGFLHDLELPSGRAQRVFSAAITASCAADRLDGSETTAELLELLEGAPIEGLALAAAAADLAYEGHSYTRTVVEEWLSKHRHIRLQITGDDLLAAGVAEGPEIGRRLERVFAMRMMGLVDEGREAELVAALADEE